MSDIHLGMMWDRQMFSLGIEESVNYVSQKWNYCIAGLTVELLLWTHVTTVLKLYIWPFAAFYFVLVIFCINVYIV